MSGDCWERETLPWEAVVWEAGSRLIMGRVFSTIPPREDATRTLDDVVDASLPEDCRLSESDDRGDAEERFADEALEALE